VRPLDVFAFWHRFLGLSQLQTWNLIFPSTSGGSFVNNPLLLQI
jgi:hypothetical protein